MRVNKYVLDANIWLSYFISNRTGFLVKIVAEKDVTIYRCNELIEELKRILGYRHIQKHNIDTNAAIKFIKSITLDKQLIYPVKNYIPGDKDDNYIVALALQTNSGFITSGDNHILSQKDILEQRFPKLQIITKAQFEKKFLRDDE
jgi:putative PIN family toxin of toxin-antitoxin system